MGDGQTGTLVNAQYHAVEVLKRNSDSAITPHHHVEARSAVEKKWRVWSAMSFLVMLKVRKLIITGFFTDRAQNKYLYEVGWPLLALLQIVSDSPLKMYSKFVLS